MDLKTASNRWFLGADEAWEAMLGLIEAKQNHFALFFLHLSLEKTLKGLHLVKYHEPAPYIHDLVQLTRKIQVETSELEEEQLAEISTFNIAARYDDYKYRLYKKATPEFVEKWIAVGKDLREKFLKEVRKYE